jgi:hypothetical protein
MLHIVFFLRTQVFINIHKLTNIINMPLKPIFV